MSLASASLYLGALIFVFECRFSPRNSSADHKNRERLKRTLASPFAPGCWSRGMAQSAMASARTW